ncbi:protein-methionine-sulfoxide reductase heme-binding subunit MsrQ [Roseobacter sp. HKCCD9010]|jgi:sulfoxide reductase heme-binding subunit YedZ|uniref:protein-methionine-sulfoxide reductase heme-binding subunit MsrQ n=1 Tax=unclassified Roseobacter TaxID=196798 RepID=UPI00119B5D4A|nr:MULTISPECIES: protein-methionine-sulfoxide reductase heme-binding subunit MsrQ [unclassified Roseobacter]MBF9048671.1 protein-methionine-sulfoxide reductase heme-binding subunit MsrQ [Rhodobacterales bacterium HKCCD4356]NNV10670.1 protein-methionine-sulfoxide reductase heme-binding subunit MsrQ [Roseobacter sp. HKCCD7357]NNV14855.1 protein-methionine-sulfoxide reductase heme-binding subunit MsrQ [Roseobacter sp. HKCCD8768]NNV24314.1 protein-methionine-sulfoxide reductase heme-binding subunit
MLTDRINRGLRLVPPWLLYIVGAAWAAWLFYLGATGGLGVEPIEALEHEYGEIALQLVILGLVVTPLRQIAGINAFKFRRAIGVVAFFYVLAHFLVWALLDVQSLSRVWADIVDRPYITIGMAGFALLIPLAVTSNNLSVRRMGAAAWRKLHKLVYPAALLGAVHYVWLAKGFQLEPMIYLAVVLGLLALRLPVIRTRLAS